MPATLPLIATASAVAQFVLHILGQADAAKSLGLISPAIPGFASLTAQKRLELQFHRSIQAYSKSSEFAPSQRVEFKRVDETVSTLVQGLKPYTMSDVQAGDPLWVERHLRGSNYPPLRRSFEEDGLEQALDWVVSATAHHLALLARNSGQFAPNALLEMLHRLADLKEHLDASIDKKPDNSKDALEHARADSDTQTVLQRSEEAPFRRNVNFGQPKRAPFVQVSHLVNARLQAALASGTAATVLVTGKLGHGKTQAVREVLQGSLSQGRYWHFWVDASSLETLIDGYVGAAREIDLIGPHAGDPRLSARAFLARLDETSGWIVVLDGVSLAIEDLDDWLPRGPGRVIVTTELGSLGVLSTRGKVDTIRVAAFTVNESLSYLRSRLGPAAQHRGNGAGALTRLARQLDHNPAAMSIAAAMLVGDQGMSSADFLQKLEDPQTPLNSAFASNTDRATALIEFWRLAVESAHQADPTALARPIIGVMSLLDSSFIPDELLTSPALLAFLGEELGTNKVKRADVRGSLNALTNQEMVRSVKKGKMHGWAASSLMMRGLRETLTDATSERATLAAAEAIMDLWSRPDVDGLHTSTLRTNAAWLALGRPGLGEGARMNHLLIDEGCHPLVFSLLNEFADNGDAAGAHSVYSSILLRIPLGTAQLSDALAVRLQLADLRAEMGDSDGAIADLRNLVDYASALPMGTDRDANCSDIHYRSRYVLGRRLAKADRTREALEVFEALLKDYGLNCPNTEDIFRCRYQAARAKAQLGRVATAIDELQLLYSDQKMSTTVPKRHVLKTHAEIYRWVGHSGEAALAYRELESMRPDCQKIFGSESKEMLALRRKIAYWRGKCGDSEGAASDNGVLAVDCTRILGPRHRDTLAVRRNGAYWLGKSGSWREGARRAEVVRFDTTEALGAHHPHALVAWRTQAVMVGDAGDPVRAANELGDVLAAMCKHMGADSPQAIDCQRFHADWLGNAGLPGAAASAHRKLTSDLATLLGEDNPRTLLAKRNYGKWLTRSGRPSAARAVFRELVEQMVGVHGLRQQETLSVLEWQAEAIGVSGNAFSAAKRFLHCAEVLDDSLGPNHPETLLAWNGHYYWMTKVSPEDAAVAVEQLEVLVAVVDDVLGNESVAALTVDGNHAYALGKSGEHRSAVDAFSDVLARARAVLSPSNPEVLILRSNAARFLMRSKAPEAVRELESVVRQMRVASGEVDGSLEAGHPQLLTARRRLACAYRADGHMDQAIELMSEVIRDQADALDPTHPQALRAVAILGRWLEE